MQLVVTTFSVKMVCFLEMVGNRPEGIVSVIPSPKGRQDVTGSIYLSVCLFVSGLAEYSVSLSSFKFA